MGAFSFVPSTALGYSWPMYKRALFFSLLLTLPFAALADKGYKIVRPDGTVEFSDQPQEGAEEVELPEAQTYERLRGTTLAPAEAKSKGVSKNGYSNFAITSPAQDETVRPSGNRIIVNLSLEPGLSEGHVIVLSLDGKEAGRGRGLSFGVDEVYRGSHSVSAAILDAEGKTLIRSEAVTFHVKQHSTLH